MGRQNPSVAKTPAGATTVGTTSTIIIPANDDRADLDIRNRSAQTIFLAKGPTATINAGIELQPTEVYSLTAHASGRIYTGPISAICGVGGQPIAFSEE